MHRLGAALRTHCWDERDGFYYSVDLNLTPRQTQTWTKHSGQVRDWPCLKQCQEWKKKLQLDAFALKIIGLQDAHKYGTL